MPITATITDPMFDKGQHSRAKIGFVLLATEQTIEENAFRLCPQDVGMHFTRAANPDSITVESLSRQAGDLARAASTLLPDGSGSIFSFGIKGGREAGRKFIEAVQIHSHLANVGDAKSLVIHPASTTHQQMDAQALQAAGVGEDMIRMSVGLEDFRDLRDDLKQALRISQKG